MTENGQEKQKVIQEWLDKAEHDFITIRLALSAPEQPYDIACYHAQQCIEKLLKASLIQKEKSFRKTHDLEDLAKEVTQLYDQLSLPIDDIEWLSIIGVSARYPGYKITESDAHKARDICISLREKLLALL